MAETVAPSGVRTLPAEPPPIERVIPGTKQVAHESAPMLSAVTLAGTIADTWQLVVEHLGWWKLPNSLFVALGAVLFFLFRSIAKGLHVRSARIREDRDRAFMVTLVSSGVVVPVPPNPYVHEAVPVPVRAAGDVGPAAGA